MKEDCVSVNWQAFFKCGIRIGFMLCRKAQKKNRLVTNIKGTTYLFDLFMQLFKVVHHKITDVCFLTSLRTYISLSGDRFHPALKWYWEMLADCDCRENAGL